MIAKILFSTAVMAFALSGPSASAQTAPAPVVGPDMAEPPIPEYMMPSSGRFMPRELAVEAALAALDACKKRSAFNAVVVMDMSGQVMVEIVETGAKHILPGAAEKKARMASYIGRATSETAGIANMQEKIRDVVGDGVTNVSGAVPFIANKEVIGIIAVGGRNGVEESWCAYQGVKKVQSRLK